MRSDLPSGTVTFLFTDVEGSTKLLHELGAEGYAQALAQHRRVIRKACGAEGGVEVDTQGDAFFFAFPTEPGALAAAEAMTAELAPGPIQVRVGLHTGTPLLTDEGYVGDDVHFAARVAASGHGGQVILSQATAQAVDIELIDLGEHRLKDIAEAVAIFQLGEGSFPPLKTMSNTNLPRPVSSFVGREDEVGDVLAKIAQGARLLTLTGPGGTGKTRLALEAASTLVPEYNAGVFWVGLASLRDAALVSETISQTLGAKDGLAEHIGEREMLLLLDNLEQVIEAAPELSSLLSACPNLTLFVTSRELLRVQGEVEYAVPPLAEPEAIALFCERSQLEPSEEIAELCARLDNLPLAVELAAARAKALSPAQILERLSQRLDLLKGGRDADVRQQTLRATIDWSYNLLDAKEQQLFARLSVFAGGCTLETAEEVADADLDTLLSLVEKSLLRFSNERYWMLETIREYAGERLSADEEGVRTRRRHAESMRALAESLGLTMENLEKTRRQRHDVAMVEQDNLRAAIEWALRADLALAVQIAFALENFWVTHNPEEGIRRFDSFLARREELPSELAAAANRARGNCTILAGDRREGVRYYEQARDLYRATGDAVGVALMEHRITVNTLEAAGDASGRARLEACLARFRELGLGSGETQVLGTLGWLEQRAGNSERALELLRESADRAHAVGFTWTEQTQYEDLAHVELDLGHLEDAERSARRALELARTTGDRQSMVSSLSLLALIAVAAGAAGLAGRLWGAVEAESARGSLGMWANEQRERDAKAVAAAESDPAFARGRETGRRGTLEEAVEYALASID